MIEISRVREFESRHRIQDGYIFTFNCCSIVKKTKNKRKRVRRLPKVELDLTLGWFEFFILLGANG